MPPPSTRPPASLGAGSPATAQADTDQLDVIVGKIALQRGLIDAPKLADCLRVCATASRPLADILVTRGFIARQDVAAIARDLSPLLARAADIAHIHDEDIRLAKALIGRKLVTEDRARAALTAQAAEAKASPAAVPRLGFLLLRDGDISFDSLRPLLHAGARAEFTCPQCRALYSLPMEAAKRAWSCRRCTGRLVPRTGNTSARPAATAAVPVPPEVHEAAKDPKNKFGKYYLLRELGRGGMGAVYQAWDSALSRWTAVKILLGRGSAEDAARFAREAQTAAQLKHPNIVATYDVSAEGDRHYIAMEFIDGHALGGEKIAVRRACEIVREVALAVDHAHGLGIIHRDLKPANIMVDKSGRAIVMDFGLARSLAKESRLTAEGTVIGTPAYMSPEQARGEQAKIDRLSDVYSLGAILYELLTGRPPFHGKTPIETLSLVVKTDAEPPSRHNMTVSRDLDNIVLKAIAKDRARRYQTAKGLAGDLKRYLDGGDVKAKGVSPLVRYWKPIAGAAGGVVVAIALAVALSGSKPPPLLKKKGPDPNIEEAATRKRQEEARQQAVPILGEGQRRFDDALKDLYRPTADLNPFRAKIREAIAEFTRAIGVSPDYAEAYHARGRAHRELRDFPSAETDQAKAIALNAKYGLAWRERGRCRFEQYWDLSKQKLAGTEDRIARLRGEALADFRRAAELGDAGVEAQWAAAAVAMIEARYDEALGILAPVIDGGRSNEEHHLLRGLVYSWMNQKFPEAIAAYTKAIELRPNYSTAYQERAALYHHQGAPRFNEALRDFERAAELDPGEALHQRNIAVHLKIAALRDNDRALYDRATEHIEKALRINPRDVHSLTLRGVMHTEQKRTDAALADYEEAIRIDPKAYDARFNRAGLWLESKPKQAFEEADALTRDYPKFARVWMLRGIARCQLAEWKEAVADLEKAGAMDPSQKDNCAPFLKQARARLGQ